jgi:hypothetical protein
MPAICQTDLYMTKYGMSQLKVKFLNYYSVTGLQKRDVWITLLAPAILSITYCTVLGHWWHHSISDTSFICDCTSRYYNLSSYTEFWPSDILPRSGPLMPSVLRFLFPYGIRNTSDSYVLDFVGRPLWREDGSVFCMCRWPLLAHSFLGPRPFGLATVFYCLRFETSLFVASYDSQGHGGGIRPRFHTGSNWLTSELVSIVTSQHRLHRKHCSLLYSNYFCGNMFVCEGVTQ